ncbi:hypothetical protein ACFSTD_19915 [Novosphingobium colocasiae]
MSRVKMFGAIPRKPGITSKWFHDHYRHPHGTMGRHISTMRAYTQSHQVHSDLLGEKADPFRSLRRSVVRLRRRCAYLSAGTQLRGDADP